jgi:allophanate hydrolase subunit 1
LLGQTAAILFEPDRDPAALLRAGDYVRFDPRERLADATVDIA